MFDGCLGSRRRITGGRKELWMSKRLHHPPCGFTGQLGDHANCLPKRSRANRGLDLGASRCEASALNRSAKTGSLCTRPSQKGARAESKICKKHETEKMARRVPISKKFSAPKPLFIAEMICILEPCGVQFVSCLQPPRCPARREIGEEQGFGVEGCENLTPTGGKRPKLTFYKNCNQAPRIVPLPESGSRFSDFSVQRHVRHGMRQQRGRGKEV